MIQPRLCCSWITYIIYGSQWRTLAIVKVVNPVQHGFNMGLIWFNMDLIWFNMDLLWFNMDLLWFNMDLIWFNMDLIWFNMV